jgi:hypothetical protein
MFLKKEKVYTDRLADYRKIKCWDFHLFDEVIIEETHNKFDEKWVLWILVWSRMYDDTNQLCYFAVTKTWESVQYITHCKKYYWEFQEEFEALDETERLSKEVQERLQKLEQLKKKTDKIRDINFKNLWLQPHTTHSAQLSTTE